MFKKKKGRKKKVEHVIKREQTKRKKQNTNKIGKIWLERVVEYWKSGT